jgi:2-polyprenyl-6-methoxyphenol hydroxylase-like FAD-dependent oxidoreductase
MPARPTQDRGDSGAAAAGGGTHALVVGASMAGLLAARVLADHNDRVTVVDRDRLPSEPVARKGVPQSRHLHFLLGQGLAIIGDLFPGIVDDLKAHGALPVSLPGDCLWLNGAGWSRRFRPGLGILSASRGLFEYTVRQRVLALPGVTIRDRHSVEGLTTDAEGRVTGLRVQAMGEPSPDHDGDDEERPRGAAEQLGADLVVDASGRTSRTPRWLQAMGFPAPAETTITAHLGYASRIYDIPDGFDGDWKMLYLQAKPPDNTRMGLLFPIEGDRWIVTLCGAGRDYPPTDEDGFLEFARTLRHPVLYEAIRDAKPVSPIAGYQRTANVRRHYERLERRPERLLVTGDAATAFNPIYAQGMTAAAIGARTLAGSLDAHRRAHAGAGFDGLAGAFQAALAKATASVWLEATSEDLRYPTTDGGKLQLSTKAIYAYLARAIRVGNGNETVNTALLRVINLFDEPTTLFRPQVLLPVLSGRTAPPLPLDRTPADTT